MTRSRRIALAVAWILVVLAAVLDWRIAHISDVSKPSGKFTVSHEHVSWPREKSDARIEADVWTPAADGKIPLLLFSPGLGQEPSAYSVMLADIASHGYLIVGVAHDTALQNGEQFTRIAGNIGRELSVVLDSISAAVAPSLLGAADLTRVGAFGHSLGGAAVAVALYNDPRFKAGADLDGTVFGEPVTLGVRQPFLLMLAKFTIFDSKPDGPPEFTPDNDQLRIHEDSMMAHSPNAIRLTVDGLRHMNFSDKGFRGGFVAQFPEAVGLRISAPRTVEIATWYITRFFAGETREQLRQAPFGEVEIR